MKTTTILLRNFTDDLVEFCLCFCSFWLILSNSYGEQIFYDCKWNVPHISIKCSENVKVNINIGTLSAAMKSSSSEVRLLG